MTVIVQFLRWSDLDPTNRSFDAGPARTVAEECVLGGVRDPSLVEASLDRALLAEYGAWAAGWRWATSEPGGGGPVRGWCCPRDSILRSDDPGPTTTADRAVGALREWHGFLCDLAEIFRALRDATAAMPIEQAVEHAAGRLLPVVLERTSNEDAWYQTFARVLRWYLESAGHPPERVQEAVDGVVEGRFESWVAPNDQTGRATCSELGREVAQSLLADFGPRDALSAWIEIRTSAFTHPPSAGPQDPVRFDAHRRYIEGPERTRDPERSRRLMAALEACRSSATKGRPLTLDRLAQWQALVLGRERVAFRTTDAFAKGGRERYPIAPDTQARFEKALSEANDSATPIAIRAARAYLDVCFFHPFDDGNGRAARLALDHLLTREGLSLHSVEPLFVVSRAADDCHGAWSLAYVLQLLMGPTTRFKGE